MCVCGYGVVSGDIYSQNLSSACPSRSRWPLSTVRAFRARAWVGGWMRGSEGVKEGMKDVRKRRTIKEGKSSDSLCWVFFALRLSARYSLLVIHEQYNGSSLSPILPYASPFALRPPRNGNGVRCGLSVRTAARLGRR
eukprot:GHVU01061693.1.p3 GENE.GHVU01061693.1~~GHVU01061693.1.p3  ORF type:complete len:138 (-),score=2.77 GHVU01061693.1:262-675(-)